MKILRFILQVYLITFVILVTPASAEAGIFSLLSKLGKTTHKVDSPDIDLPDTVNFKELTNNLPEGSAAEISLVNDNWLAKTPDGKTKSVTEFVDHVNDSNNTSTLILRESNLPKSLSHFNSLPEGLAVKIISRNGNIYKLNRAGIPLTLKYKNIELSLSDTSKLDSVLWQLQRPVMTKKVRFVQLSNNVNTELPSQIMGAKPTIETVGMNGLLNSIKGLRFETMVLSGKVKEGVLHYGEQRIPIKQLEDAAASSDVNLIILGSDNSKKVLQNLTHNLKEQANSVADFYNRFVPTDTATPMRIKMTDSGELQTGIHIEIPATTSVENVSSHPDHLAIMSLHLMVESVKILQPSEERVKELDRRIFPTIHSSIQFYVIISFFSGLLFAVTSWFLYLKIWRSPERVNYGNIFSFSGIYLLHRFGFVLLYLPILGLISPFYLMVTWTYAVINTLLIKPIIWLASKFK